MLCKRQIWNKILTNLSTRESKKPEYKKYTNFLELQQHSARKNYEHLSISINIVDKFYSKFDVYTKSNLHETK